MKDRKLTYQELESTKNHHTRRTAEFSIWLHDIRSLHNVGSVFRTCDGSGAQHLYLSGYTPHPPRDDLSKTALGADKSVPFTFSKSFLEIAKEIHSSGREIVAVELTENAIPYNELDAAKANSVFLFGNEISGLPQELLDIADLSTVIPMLGIKHSLNVSVAAGIIAYRGLEISKI